MEVGVGSHYTMLGDQLTKQNLFILIFWNKDLYRYERSFMKNIKVGLGKEKALLRFEFGVE